MRVDSTGLIVGKSGGSTGGGRVDVAIVMKCTGFNNKFQDSLSCVQTCNRTHISIRDCGETVSLNKL